jgi:O-antigen/teichoic acid export membrane protein
VTVGLLSRVTRGGFARDAALTYLATGVTLVVNLGAGVVIARSLGPSGRGTLAAILTLADVATGVFALGAAAAVGYHVARRPEDGGRLLSTWMAMLIPLAAVAIATAEVLIGVLFAAQSEETRDLARLYALSLVVTMLVQPLNGLVFGERRTALASAIRIAQPLTVLAALLALLVLGELTVERALVATLTGTVVAGALAAVHTLRRHPLARPSRRLGRASLRYGLRGLPATLTQAVNMRLDLVIMPAFLSASSVGLYSVATNVSWLVVAVSSPMWWLVMPTAASRGERGAETVLASFHVTLGISIALAAAVAVSAATLVPAIYGEPFTPAITALYLLLPGCVLLPAAQMLTSGIYATGRPFTSALPQVTGSVVTVTGLLLFLQSGGIEAAAAVTSVAYAVILVVALVVYRRITGFPWRALVPHRPGGSSRRTSSSR